MLYVLVENGQVTQCVDTPQEGSDWKSAIEVKPELQKNRQVYGAHYFDLSKNPVEIVWPVEPRNVDDRKRDIQGRIQNICSETCQLEFNNALFENRDVNNAIIQSARADRDTNLASISAAQDHDDLDALNFD